MSMPIPNFRPTDPVTDVINAINEQGAAIIEGLAPPETLREINQELSPIIDRANDGDSPFVGVHTKRIGGLVTKVPSCHNLVMHSEVLEIANAILGKYCERIQLHVAQAMSVGPNSDAQPLHRDGDTFPSLPGIETQINAMWAASRFTRRNGATAIALGSHLWPEDRQPTAEEMSYAEMEAGSVCFFVGKAVHGAGQNISNERRTGLCIGYSLGWLRQFENQYLHVPPNVARTLDPELAALIGYAAHRPQLGLYEARDPMDSLAEGLPDNQVPTDVFDEASQNRCAEYISTYGQIQTAV